MTGTLTEQSISCSCQNCNFEITEVERGIEPMLFHCIDQQHRIKIEIHRIYDFGPDLTQEKNS